MNITKNNALMFANEWISAWNAHNLDEILSHYSPEIVFFSPIAEKRVGNGRVEGIAALRTYWTVGLNARPDLKFDLIDVLSGYSFLTVLYYTDHGQKVAETFEFQDDGKVCRAAACYS